MADLQSTGAWASIMSWVKGLFKCSPSSTIKGNKNRVRTEDHRAKAKEGDAISGAKASNSGIAVNTGDGSPVNINTGTGDTVGGNKYT